MPFNTIPLLHRTIQQVNNRLITPHIVTNNQDITESCKRKNAFIFHPQHTAKCVDTLLSTKSLWNSHVYVLLGDVYYNKTCLNMTFNCNKNLCVIGNQVEIFSLSFVPSQKIINALLTASTQTDLGKLWHFYRAYCNIPLNQHKRDTESVLSIPSDGTNDIDTYEDYLQLKSEVDN